MTDSPISPLSARSTSITCTFAPVLSVSRDVTTPTIAPFALASEFAGCAKTQEHAPLRLTRPHGKDDQRAGENRQRATR